MEEEFDELLKIMKTFLIKIERMKKAIGILVFVLVSLYGFSQDMPWDQVDHSFTVQQNGCEATIIGKLKIRNGWHINALVLPKGSFGIPTTFEIKKSPNFKLVGKRIAPKPLHKFDKLSGEMLDLYEGSIIIKQKIKITTKKDFDLTLTFGFQTCDTVKCLFPVTKDFTVHVKGCSPSSDEGSVIPPTSKENDKTADDKSETTATNDTAQNSVAANTSPTTAQTKNAADTTQQSGTASVATNSSNNSSKNHSLWVVFGLAFLAGLAALMTPCVFPMIPMTVSFFTKQSTTKAKGIRNAIKYGVAIMIIYVLLGTIVTAIFGGAALNNIATNPTVNIIFFLVFVIFAVSFLGAFEITLPSSWINKADAKADKAGGMIGIFFMALVLVLVSFSCTLPIVGSLLVQGAREGGAAPVVGMFAFSLALALPFALFAAFPGWMNSLPKSGGWLNAVKVVLGLIELAFAFKFLSNADLSLQLHLIERETFIAIWIAIFAVMALYLFGKIRFPLDSPVEKLSVGRGMLATFVLAFVIYLLPGMWGAPLNLINAFPPPKSYSESPYGVGFEGNGMQGEMQKVEKIDGTFLGPQNIMVFHDYDKAKSYAKKVNKPLFIDFTGFNCVNCRRMEEKVWGTPQVKGFLKDSVVIASLHVDSRVKMPKSEWKEVTMPGGDKMTLKTFGDKWMFMEISRYQTASQPYYIMQNTKGEDLSNGSADYQHDRDSDVFLKWLKAGLQDFNASK